MPFSRLGLAGVLAMSLPGAALAARFTLTLPGVPDGQPMPARYSFCTRGADQHIHPGSDISPPLTWSGVPAGTRSFALTMIDPDVPARMTEAETRTGVPVSAQRQIFVHWLLADMGPGLRALPEGADGDGPVAHGKPPIRTRYGVRGANDFTFALSEDARHNGVHAGYDGPCPPSIDLKPHGYEITLYALDVAHLPLDGGFTRDDLMAAMKGHVLGKARTIATYSILKPSLRAKGQ